MNDSLTHSPKKIFSLLLKLSLFAFPLYTFSVWTYIYYAYNKELQSFKTGKLQDYTWGLNPHTALLINEICLILLIVLLVRKAILSKKNISNAIFLAIVLILFCINSLSWI